MTLFIRLGFAFETSFYPLTKLMPYHNTRVLDSDMNETHRPNLTWFKIHKGL